MKVKNAKIINSSDLNKLVVDTYKKPYNFQQQDGCMINSTFELTIPFENIHEEGMNESIPEITNGATIGVKFEAWLKRDPKRPIGEVTLDWKIKMFWERSFYPNIQTIANDLYKKGLIKKGTYIINIWQ